MGLETTSKFVTFINRSDMTPQFAYTNAERRASTSIAGSLGRSNLFIPQDFIHQSPDELEDALDTMDSDSDNSSNEPRTYNVPEEEETMLPPISHSISVASSIGPGLSKFPSRRESMQILTDEAKLLRQNKLAIKRYPTSSTVIREPSNASLYGSITNLAPQELEPNEADAVAETWEDAIKSGKIHTTPQFELKSISISSIPLIITFLLQSSLGVCSVFAVGHISSKALAGVTLGMMSSNMTAIAVISGLASSLDTFLPQAYGAGKYKLVGLIFQRCAVLVCCVMAVICTLWWLYAERILLMILPDEESAHYATQYLKVVSFGIPGYIFFETGKRFLQAQRIFDAPSYILFVCAPLNAIMNYTFVWKMGFGYIGAPMAVAINYTLMALGLLLYTAYTKNEANPRKCWCGIHFSRIFKNWNELILLSIPNLIMIISEFLSFEILTFLASYLGTDSLAAQSVISTMASVTYQIPYGVSIAASTRIANFLGAQLPEAAHIATKMVFVTTGIAGFVNFAFLLFGRRVIANWFTNDESVIKIIMDTLPVVSLIQFFDAANATSAGCLRGQGMQKIGGEVNLVAYYLVGIPVGVTLAFYYPPSNPLGLSGLWSGIGLALIIVAVVQGYCVLNPDYDKLLADAARRSNTD